MRHLDIGACFLGAKLKSPFTPDDRNNVYFQSREQKRYVELFCNPERSETTAFLMTIFAAGDSGAITKTLLRPDKHTVIRFAYSITVQEHEHIGAKCCPFVTTAQFALCYHAGCQLKQKIIEAHLLLRWDTHEEGVHVILRHESLACYC